MSGHLPALRGFPLPLHYGTTGQPWPEGSYWMMECRCPSGAVLFWTDDPDFHGGVGWAYQAVFSAGFATRADAESAFHARAPKPVDGGLYFSVQHIWTAE